jgi:hypothetical protein
MKEMVVPDHAFTRRLAPAMLDEAKLGEHLERNTRKFLRHFTRQRCASGFGWLNAAARREENGLMRRLERQHETVAKDSFCHLRVRITILNNGGVTPRRRALVYPDRHHERQLWSNTATVRLWPVSDIHATGAG